MMRLNYY